jgi:hypothetical protein
MGFLQDFGLVAKKQAPMSKDFSLYKKNTTTDIKRLAKPLKPLDRAKLYGILKEEGRWGKTTSNRQIVDMMRKRREARPFRDRIKDQVLTVKTRPGMTPEEIERNVRLSTFDRIREESEAKFGQGSTYQKESTLAGSYGKGEVGATAKRPGATRDTTNPGDKKIDDKRNTVHLPV